MTKSRRLVVLTATITGFGALAAGSVSAIGGTTTCVSHDNGAVDSSTCIDTRDPAAALARIDQRIDAAEARVEARLERAEHRAEAFVEGTEHRAEAFVDHLGTEGEALIADVATGVSSSRQFARETARGAHQVASQEVGHAVSFAGNEAGHVTSFATDTFADALSLTESLVPNVAPEATEAAEGLLGLGRELVDEVTGEAIGGIAEVEAEAGSIIDGAIATVGSIPGIAGGFLPGPLGASAGVQGGAQTSGSGASAQGSGGVSFGLGIG